MFAPVVKAAHVAHSADAVAGAAAAAIRDAVAAPTRPVYLEIATDLLAAEVPAPARRCPRGDRRGGRRDGDATSPAAGAPEPGELAARRTAARARLARPRARDAARGSRARSGR